MYFITGKLLGCFLGKCSGSIRSIARHPELPVIASCGEYILGFSLCVNLHKDADIHTHTTPFAHTYKQKDKSVVCVSYCVCIPSAISFFFFFWLNGHASSPCVQMSSSALIF